MNPHSIRTGVIAGVGLMLFYTAVVAGASRPWDHFTDQATADWYYL